MKYFKIFFIFIFIVFAFVQYNDPDPIHWILTYLFASYLCFLSFKNKIERKSLIYLAVVFLLWAINVFPPQWEGVTLDALGMKNINIELGRESLGLGIIALVLTFLSFFHES